MSGEKPKRVVHEGEYNPQEPERAEWRRVIRTHAGKIEVGKVVLHINGGEVLKVETREVIRKAE